ncbi:hypothetical protein EWM64_g114 [Hericium alpestre]|uniref:Ribosome biogenesis protein NSA1 n=1 Tax=Hericium alpestre TaxID=135208 RepID=A0A4Z0ABX8_9AGAM|nr:hypothetical protein EWM64_g114 [Hericium alpestre]
MPRFLAGDELGNIKSLTCTYSEKAGETKAKVTTLYDGTESGKDRSIQAMSVAPDGTLRSLFLDASSHTSHTSVLPMRLCDWRLSPDEKAFAYAGDEVELSIWDAEAAFTAKAKPNTLENETKKRKRADDLLPGETWRAKNVANDTLNLRQPVRNTCLTYLSASPSASSSASHHHLAVGTQFGNVRRYDTRSARRPVADWKGIAKVGGIKAIEKGPHEHDLFVADHGCNVYAVDLRNGRVVYGYQGISGAVNSLAVSPTVLASSALDRYLRIHSVFPPPTNSGDQQEKKGQVVEKVFVKSTPTVIVWDRDLKNVEGPRADMEDEDDDDDEDVWEGMDDAEDDESDEEGARAKRRSKKSSKTA